MAETFSQAWVDEMIRRLRLLRSGQIWIDQKGQMVYTDSVQTKLRITPKSHEYVDFYDDFGLKTMKKKEFIQKYNYCGEAFVRREELNTFKNLGVKKDA